MIGLGEIMAFIASIVFLAFAVSVWCLRRKEVDLCSHDFHQETCMRCGKSLDEVML